MPRIMPIVVASLILVAVLSAGALPTSPRDITSNPERFDGQIATVDGQVTNLRTRVSRRSRRQI